MTGCDPHKIYYTDGVYDSAYVLIDEDPSIDAACEDSCVYTKYNIIVLIFIAKPIIRVGATDGAEYCFELGTGTDEATTEYRIPCSR